MKFKYLAVSFTILILASLGKSQDASEKVFSHFENLRKTINLRKESLQEQINNYHGEILRYIQIAEDDVNNKINKQIEVFLNSYNNQIEVNKCFKDVDETGGLIHKYMNLRFENDNTEIEKIFGVLQV